MNSEPDSRGLVELFTGNGKGKTSAALGVVLRAVGQGLRVHIIYFMKGDFPYGERNALSYLPNVSFQSFGHLHFIDPEDIKEDEREQARELDALLAEAVPALEPRVLGQLEGDDSVVRKWYLLGSSLRELIASSDLVMSADVDSGDFWKSKCFCNYSPHKIHSGFLSSPLKMRRNEKNNQLEEAVEILMPEPAHPLSLAQIPDVQHSAPMVHSHSVVS